jgi:hypothetical protein
MASFLDFLGQLASTGLPIAGGIAQGTSQGIQKRAELDRLRQQMEIDRAQEGRAAQTHPFTLGEKRQGAALATPTLRSAYAKSRGLAEGDITPDLGQEFALGAMQKDQLAELRARAAARASKSREELAAIRANATDARAYRAGLLSEQRAWISARANTFDESVKAEAEEKLSRINDDLRFFEMGAGGPARDLLRGAATQEAARAGIVPVGPQVVEGRRTRIPINPATGVQWLEADWDKFSPPQKARLRAGREPGPRR